MHLHLHLHRLASPGLASHRIITVLTTLRPAVVNIATPGSSIACRVRSSVDGLQKALCGTSVASELC